MEDKLVQRMEADRGWVAEQMMKVRGFREGNEEIFYITENFIVEKVQVVLLHWYCSL